MMLARPLVLSTLALGALLTTSAGAAPLPRAATLTVTGEASVSRAPDRVQVAFSIQTTDADATKAASANATVANGVIARMAALGLPASAVATTGYGLSFVPRPSKPDPASDQRYGYTVNRTLTVTLDAVDRAGAVVDAGVAAGVTNVDGVAFQLRDPHAAQRAAQTAALDDAVQQARGLAAAAGLRLVRILAIAPGGSSGPRPMMMMRTAAVGGMAAPVPTTIDPGALTVQAEVTVEYEIAPAKPM
jgi:uncharacterized protein YggE